jgi:prolipoprotein diacylglyceryltransferase
MYPKISDFINDLFGTHIVLPIQSFGFFLALAFLGAYLVLQADLRRKEKLGIFPFWKTTLITSGPIPQSEVLISLLMYGVLGFKLGLMLEDYTAFANNPQDAILSADGSMLWAIVLGVAGGGYKFWQYRNARNAKTEEEEVEQSATALLPTVITIAFVAGIIGSKIFHNLEYWDEFWQDPLTGLLSFSGLTFYGGLILAAVCIALYIRKYGLPILPFADSVAPALMLAYGIGRIGCQISGDGDWGIDNLAPKPSWLSFLPDWAWAYNYPNNVLGRGVPIEGCVGDFCNQLATPVFPTPIYETLMAFAIFGVLWVLRTRLPKAGQLAAIYLMLNGAERFTIELIRVNATVPLFGMQVTQAEIIAVGFIIAGAVLLFFTSRRSVAA